LSSSFWLKLDLEVLFQEEYRCSLCLVTKVLLSGQNMPFETQGVLLGKSIDTVNWWMGVDKSLLE